VRVVSSTPDSYHLRVQSDGTPFWLVLGQSHNDGWEATIDGRSLGAPTLVNGFANGWVVRGQTGTFDVTLRWTPQRTVWIAIGVSLAVIALCVVLVFVLRRRRRLDDPPLADAPTRRALRSASERATSLAIAIAAGVSAGVVVALFSRAWIGLAVGLLTALATRRPRCVTVLAVGAPTALAIGALLDRPELGWLAVALLTGDLIGAAWRGRSGAKMPSDLPE
jgi:arabinofuranan 3-O-arabinosyltransferase